MTKEHRIRMEAAFTDPRSDFGDAHAATLERSPALKRCRVLIMGLQSEVRNLPPAGGNLGYVEAMVSLLIDAFNTYEEGVEKLLGGVSIEEMARAQLAASEDEQRVVFPPSRFAVDEVFQFLAYHRKTGTVRVALKEETIELDLRQGMVVDARSDSPPNGDRLGELLVRRGCITAERLEACLSEAQGSSKRFGRWLVHHEIITQDSLRTILELQLRRMLHRILKATRAPVDFRPRENPYGRADYSLDLMGLILHCIAMAENPTPLQPFPQIG